MKLSRAVAWLVALAAAAVAVVAVVNGGTRAPTPAAPTRGNDDGFPRTIELPAGGEVRLAHRPERIVVANTAVLDAVAALVPPERVAALCRQAFTWSEIARQPAGWENRPSFPVFVAESVLAHDPDLVLCSPHSLPETVTTLQSLGIPVVAVPLAESLDDVFANLDLVARALGAEPQARELRRRLDDRIARLRADASGRAGLRVLLYTWSGDEGWSSGGGTLEDVMLSLAGVRNAASVAGHHGSVRLAIEQILAIDPDVFVVPAAFGEVVDASAARLRNEPALAGLRAVHDDRIIELHPSLFSTTSHEIVTAAERIAAAIDAMPGLERKR